METKFYKCQICGNVVMKVVDSGQPLTWCGEEMEELIANTEDASQEKHVPVVTQEDPCKINVQIGSVAHPMSVAHHIEFVYVETKHGGMRIDLDDRPEAEFCVCSDSPVAVYEYCNIHGLWKITL